MSRNLQDEYAESLRQKGGVSQARPHCGGSGEKRAIDTGRIRLVEELGVSCETMARLDAVVTLLDRWNRAINLVSTQSLPHLWTRHILDSAQLLRFVPSAAQEWRDIGSGGGFPGLVVAILAQEKNPSLRVTLVESDKRKAAFLETAARALDLDLDILSAREENLPESPCDVVSARAVAPLTTLVGWAHRHLQPKGLALFPKGAGHAAELDAALASWHFRVQKHRSLSGDGAILGIDRIYPRKTGGSAADR
jgi:16S rRNA (guanine527-N7)-methyltransferase